MTCTELHSGQRTSRGRDGVVPPARELAGWASLPCSPAAACRNSGCAGVLLFVSALRVRPAFIGGTVGPLLPPTPPFRRWLRWFGSKEDGQQNQD